MSVGTMPLTIHVPESAPMSRRMTMPYLFVGEVGLDRCFFYVEKSFFFFFGKGFFNEG